MSKSKMTEKQRVTIERVDTETKELCFGDRISANGIMFYFGENMSMVHQVGDTTWGRNHEGEWTEWDNSSGHNSPEKIARTE